VYGLRSRGYFAVEWGLAALALAGLALVASAIGALRTAGSRWSALTLGVFAAYTTWTFASLLWSPNRGNAWVGAGLTVLFRSRSSAPLIL
jgi:hypothetical protein